MTVQIFPSGKIWMTKKNAIFSGKVIIRFPKQWGIAVEKESYCQVLPPLSKERWTKPDKIVLGEGVVKGSSAVLPFRSWK